MATDAGAATMAPEAAPIKYVEREVLIAQIESFCKEEDYNMTSIDQQFSGFTEAINYHRGVITAEQKELSEKIKNLQFQLAAKDKAMTELNEAENKIKTRIREIGDRFARLLGLPTKKKAASFNWADEVEMQEKSVSAAPAPDSVPKEAEGKTATQPKEKTSWNLVVKGGRVINAENEVRRVPIEGSNIYISAYIINSPEDVFLDRFIGKICYLQKANLFFFYTQQTGRVYGNGLLTSNENHHTVMCHNGGGCSRQRCDFAHDTLATKRPDDIHLPHSIFYEKFVEGGRRRSPAPIPMLFPDEVEDLGALSREHRIDIQHRTGRVTMQLLLTIATLTSKYGTTWQGPH